MAKRRGKGEGSVYQRQSDRRWVGSFIVENGSRKYVYGNTRKEAYERLQQAQREYQQGMLVVGPQQTVKQYLEHWLENVHKPTIRVGSYLVYRTILNNHILPQLGHIKLNKLTPEQVESLYTKKLKEGLAPKTIAGIHGLLHKALDNAVRRGLIARNVCDVISPPRVTRHEITVLTEEQAKRLLEVAHGHRFEALLTVALTTGMRKGELLALRWQDIDFANRSVHIRRSVNRFPGFGIVENEPKTTASRRKIVLPQFVLEVLKQHKTYQDEARQKAGTAWQDHDLVFCNTIGGFQDVKHLRLSFKRLLKEAGLPEIRFHDLRHSAATILLSMGVNVKVIQELLGHSQISMTLGIYSHVLPGMQHEAMEKWDELF
jgi:integrase